MDANGDGKVSMEEYKAFHEELRSKFKEKFKDKGKGDKGKGKGGRLSLEERFKKIDSNNDGSISLSEFKKFHDEMRTGSVKTKIEKRKKKNENKDSSN